MELEKATKQNNLFSLGFIFLIKLTSGSQEEAEHLLLFFFQVQ